MKNKSTETKNKSNSLTWLIVGLCLLTFAYYKFAYNPKISTASKNVGSLQSPELTVASGDNIPIGSHGQIIHHKFYSLSYIEENEQAEWVAYVLNVNNLRRPHVKYNRRFTDDKDVKTQSAFHNDYTNTGYTRGHLVPAGDMSFDIEALRECYLMSNMSPQIKAFNNGVWKELEEQTRDWAFQKGKLYIVAGPLFNGTNVKKIGHHKIAIPNQFYKGILYIDDNENATAIGFIIPHQMCDQKLESYAVPIDVIEQKIGLNLFANLIEENIEQSVESNIDFIKWPISEARFQLRVSKWNKE